MRKIVATLLTCIFLLLLSNQITLFNILDDQVPEKVVVKRVIDGDTLELTDGRTVRLANINAPERSNLAHTQATLFLKQYENHSVNMIASEGDKYGRLVAKLYAPEYLNLELVTQGLASKFLVEEDEKELFASEELSAINEQRGIWTRSEYRNCFILEVDAGEEVLTIENICNLSLTGFTVKDESRKVYKFDRVSSSRLRLHTLDGTNNATDLFWQSKENIWNNDRDSAYLFDANGHLAGYHMYGY